MRGLLGWSDKIGVQSSQCVSFRGLLLSIRFRLRGLRLWEYLLVGESCWEGGQRHRRDLNLSSRRNWAILVYCSSRNDFTLRNSSVRSCRLGGVCSMMSSSGASPSQNHAFWPGSGFCSRKSSWMGRGSSSSRRSSCSQGMGLSEHSSRMASNMLGCALQATPAGTYIVQLYNKQLLAPPPTPQATSSPWASFSRTHTRSQQFPQWLRSNCGEGGRLILFAVCVGQQSGGKMALEGKQNERGGWVHSILVLVEVSPFSRLSRRCRNFFSNSSLYRFSNDSIIISCLRCWWLRLSGVGVGLRRQGLWGGVWGGVGWGVGFFRRSRKDCSGGNSNVLLLTITNISSFFTPPTVMNPKSPISFTPLSRLNSDSDECFFIILGCPN